MKPSIQNGVGGDVSSEAQVGETFKVYKQRWGVLFTVVMLNISCGAIWINNFPVATTVASYYGRDTKDVNWFSSLFFLGSIPFTFGASFVANKYGLRILLHLSSLLNLLSAVIRALATSGLFDNKDTQFFVGIFGQCFGAAANSAFLGISPKVSQKWFPDKEKGLATTIGAMARPLGVIITQLTVPAIVKEPDDVPLNNYIWLAPCILSQITTLMFLTREDPKTPPSRSALPVKKEQGDSFFKQVKHSFSSLPFILLMLSVGGGIGLVFCFGTLTQQILCPLGYSESFAGLVCGILLLASFAGSALITFLMKKSQKHIEITKVFIGIAALFLIGLTELYLIPDQKTLMLIMAIGYGFFGAGILPAALELAVECIYPVDETIPGTFIYMSGQMQALFFIIIIPAMAKQTYDYSSSACGVDTILYDYTVPIMFTAAIIIVCAVLTVAFFNTEYKRRNTNLHLQDPTDISESNMTKF